MSNDKCTLDFAQIDGKDYPVVSIGYDGIGMNVHNERLRVQAENEYLAELVKLQRRLSDKYNSQLVENIKQGGLEYSDVDAIVHEETKNLYTKEMDKLYYT